MIKKEVYSCEQCGQEFNNEDECKKHEALCLNDRVKRLEEEVRQLKDKAKIQYIPSYPRRDAYPECDPIVPTRPSPLQPWYSDRIICKISKN